LLVFRHRRRRLGSIDFLLILTVVVVPGGVPTRLVVAGLIVIRLIVAALVLRRRWRRLILAVLLWFGRLRRIRLVRRSLRSARRRAIIIASRNSVDRRVIRVGGIAWIVLAG
jgi:hypothetical protein